mmetsp:Transcript_19682/g.45924  ORF Transcript_19682/g.45924 Transcript_19682/m.45924 type:complete len:651 (-) Transcript_19682:64-2016(-)
MSRKGWNNSRSGAWRVQWTSSEANTAQATFKVDCENGGLTDDSADEWGYWLDDQLERRFGQDWPQRLTANSLNFSQNSLSDKGVSQLVKYLRDRRIAVQTLKLFKNSIGDHGAIAIGNLLAHSPEPLHEVHLSHNSVTEKGVCSILELICSSRRYPYPSDSNAKTDSRGHTPVWLRVEHNFINWPIIEERLEQLKITWCVAESRDGWSSRNSGAKLDAAPMICMHHSFKNQKEKAPAPPEDGGKLGGKLLLSLLHGGDGAAQSQHQSPPPVEKSTKNGSTATSLQPSSSRWAQSSQGSEPWAKQPQESAPPAYTSTSPATQEQAYGGSAAVARGSSPDSRAEEPAPFYIFLDAQVAKTMLVEEKRLFSFKSILRWCQKGLLPCVTTEDVEDAIEQERVLVCLTQAVYDTMELSTQRRLSEMYMCEGGFKECGLIEVIDSEMHDKLERATQAQERKARELQVDTDSAMLLDFAMLWQEQLKVAEQRVLVLTTKSSLSDFYHELVKDKDVRRNHLPVVMLLEEFEACIDADIVCGRGLRQAAEQPLNSSNRTGPLMRPVSGVACTASLVRRIILYQQKLPQRPLPMEETARLRACLEEVPSMLTLLLSYIDRPILGADAPQIQVQQQLHSQAECRRMVEKFGNRIQEALGKS